MPDPRIDRRKQHLLMDILVITLCAVKGCIPSMNIIAEVLEQRPKEIALNSLNVDCPIKLGNDGGGLGNGGVGERL